MMTPLRHPLRDKRSLGALIAAAGTVALTVTVATHPFAAHTGIGAVADANAQNAPACTAGYQPRTGYSMDVCLAGSGTTVTPSVNVHQIGDTGTSCQIALEIWDDANHQLAAQTLPCATGPATGTPLDLSKLSGVTVNTAPDGSVTVHAFARLIVDGQGVYIPGQGNSPTLSVPPTGIVSPPNVPAAPAFNGGNDYPWDGLPAYYAADGEKLRKDTSTNPVTIGDQWGMGYGQCVSFVAWKIYEEHGGTQHPSAVPATGGWFPSDGLALSPVRSSWGNAGIWNTTAKQAGFNVDHTPRVGAVAQWINGGNNGWFKVGHVAMVTKVYSDGSIDIAGYNMRVDTGYSTLHLTAGQGGTDTSADHPADPNDPYHTSSFPNFPVTWPDWFIHVYDGG